MRHLILVLVAALFAVFAATRPCHAYLLPFKHCPSAAIFNPSPSPSAALGRLTADVEGLRAQLSSGRLVKLDRLVVAITSAEHDVEMVLPPALAEGPQRALSSLRQASFALIEAAAKGDQAHVSQDASALLACCRSLSHECADKASSEQASAWR